MPAAASLLSATVMSWLIICIFLACSGKNTKHSYPAFALLLGSIVLLIAAVMGWSCDFTWDAPAPIYLAVAPLSLHIDSLASIFIGLLAFVGISISSFSPGYLKHLDGKINPGIYWAQLLLFAGSMLVLILAANALTFLVAWEIMAISSALLVASDMSNHTARRAAFIYLGATRVATTFLMAGFLWMFTIVRTWNFADWHFAGLPTATPAFLIMIALCIKAGIWPFHEWLPHAHPAAPAPVSAYMSGVMIKLSIYALIRIFLFSNFNSPFLGLMILTLGLVSAFWGVLYALIQNDIKRLLAYSSIENVGLIVSGVGLSLIARRLGMPVIAGISLAGALFHCINHGIFKSLLFLGAGAIDSQAHTRNLEILGGLGKRMPWTMLFFVCGSAALCSLPPLNGFSSKWILYQSLFQLGCASPSLWLAGVAIGAIGIFGLVSAIAVATFAKTIGIAFLGRPRSHFAGDAEECSSMMLLALAIPAAACVVIGALAPYVLALFQPICIKAFNKTIDWNSVYTIPNGAIYTILIVLASSIYFIWLSQKRGKVERFVTWDCGYGALSGRMQGTATSFAENVAYTFAPLLEYHRHFTIAGRDRRHFPEAITTESDVDSILEHHIYGPIVKFVRWLGEHILRLQAGSVHLYLGYMLLTLVGLMLVGILI
jgi:hydrogenase-4 component B